MALNAGSHVHQAQNCLHIQNLHSKSTAYFQPTVPFSALTDYDLFIASQFSQFVS